MIQNKTFMYIVLSLIGFALVGTNMLTPSVVFAERIPFAIQNVTQSTSAELVDGLFQIAILLPQRDDGKFYTGQLTYTSSHEVEVNVFQPPVANTSEARPVMVPGLNASISILEFQEPKNSNSVPFAGSAAILVHRSSQPFTASFSVVGELVDPEPLTN